MLEIDSESFSLHKLPSALESRDYHLMHHTHTQVRVMCYLGGGGGGGDGERGSGGGRGGARECLL